MDGVAGQFHEWELLQNSSESGSVNSPDLVADMKDLEGLEGETGGMIRADYFSIDSQRNFLKSAVSDEGSIESDNPSWVDPESETRYMSKGSRELWPDSGSDKSDECKIGELEGNETPEGFEGNGKVVSRDEFSLTQIRSNEYGLVGNVKNQTDFEGIGEIESESKDLMKVWSDSGGVGSGSLEFAETRQDSETGKDSDVNSRDGVVVSAGKSNGDGSDENRSADEMGLVKSDGEIDKKSVVWWKVPFELLKFCALRVSPVWTFSVAAAVMGVVILSRRLYKMKKKSQALHLKVAMDDKKVSQFMSRAARLNEAFSVVKRVPVIRPTLPAAGGMIQWPAMSLR